MTSKCQETLPSDLDFQLALETSEDLATSGLHSHMASWGQSQEGTKCVILQSPPRLSIPHRCQTPVARHTSLVVPLCVHSAHFSLDYLPGH